MIDSEEKLITSNVIIDLESLLKSTSTNDFSFVLIVKQLNLQVLSSLWPVLDNSGATWSCLLSVTLLLTSHFLM